MLCRFSFKLFQIILAIDHQNLSFQFWRILKFLFLLCQFQEKDEALSIDDLGKDLRSVQALQRKHEGLERDLAALGDKIRQLDELGRKLIK